MVGYERFAMVGFGIGMWVAYAMAADHPEHLERMAVAEAIIPGVSLSPALLGRRLSEARPIIGGIPLRRLGRLSSRN
jgi:pimeloyl-ACP methyl ester carboxylesterase